MFLTAAVWLVPGSLFRTSALALLLGWMVAEGLYQALGIRLWGPVYFGLDLLVVGAVVFRRSHWSDWLILLPYLWLWPHYGAPVTRDSWIAAYWLTMAQFIIAGPWPILLRGKGDYSHGSLKSREV